MEKTVLSFPTGQKASVPRPLKRLIQVAIAVALTSGVMLLMIAGNSFMTGRNASLISGYNAWLAFVRRPDILSTMIVTAIVTVMLVYWMRDRERK